MLLGMGLAALGLLIAAPHRGLLWGEAAFPLFAITLAFVILAQVAALLRVLLLIEAGRAAPASLWLPRLRCVVECELLLAILLCGPIVALFILGAQGLVPQPAPDWHGVLPAFAPQLASRAGASGLILLLIAALAWLHRAGGAAPTRLGPLLLLPLGLLLWSGAQGTLGAALGAMVLLAGMGEAAMIWRGRGSALAMILPFTVIIGLVTLLAARPSASAMLPCLLASLALLARWAEIRLPAPRDARLAALAWPLALGALGLVLIVSHVG
jgi:hypothetical protein